MLMTCTKCATCYRVDSASLGAAGRSVRCVRCRRVWFARDPDAFAAIANAHRTAVSAYLAASTADLGQQPLESGPHRTGEPWSLPQLKLALDPVEAQRQGSTGAPRAELSPASPMESADEMTLQELSREPVAA